MLLDKYLIINSVSKKNSSKDCTMMIHDYPGEFFANRIYDYTIFGLRCYTLMDTGKELSEITLIDSDIIH